jgi:hypothetical protein
MRFLSFLSPISVLVFSLTQLVQAKSAVGDRLLVVLEDEAQKGLYSKFWADLEGIASCTMFAIKERMLIELQPGSSH